MILFSFQIILHIGDASDNLPAIKAIVEGLSLRSISQTPAILIHTSGTAILLDYVQGASVSSKIYSDLDQKAIDAVPDTQFHRNVDTYIRQKVDSGTLYGKAKVAIIVPPTVYGIGSGPFKKTSIQLPFLIRFAIKNRFVNHQN